MSGETVLRYRPVHVRHLVDAPAGTPGAVQVLGRYLAPADRRGVNGPGGFVNGEVEERLLEHGTGKLTFPGGLGGDGIRHVDRFRCLGSTARAYAPGDEWIEVYEGPSPHGDLVAVVTPIGASISRTGGIDLECADGYWLLNKIRETDAGYWTHAPRDAFEHYTQAPTYFSERFTTAPPSGWTLTAGSYASGRAQLRPATSGVASVLTGPSEVSEGWRLEASLVDVVTRGDAGSAGPGLPGDRTSITAGMITASGHILEVALVNRGALVAEVVRTFPSGTTIRSSVPWLGGPVATLAIELRGRWAYGYVDGRLIGVIASGLTPASIAFSPRATAKEIVPNSGTPVAKADVDAILITRRQPFLMRAGAPGDYRLPGAPPPGGLAGEYFDDTDIAGDLDRVLSPIREPYARRLDPKVDFAAATPPTWQPAGPANGERFSARWTGSIYLDLAAGARQVRVTGLDDAARVWVGRTRMGEQAVDWWTTGGGVTVESAFLNDTLGNTNGWYPIVIEYQQAAGPAGVVLQIGRFGVGWATAQPSELSPLGVYQDLVRHESHHDALEKAAQTFGIQYQLKPRQLESGLFPGQLAPSVRVGRDTAHVLTETGSVEVGVKLSAEEVAHTMIVDGAGVSDQAGAAQLSKEAIDYTAISQHLIVHQAVENLADLQAPGLLEQRANSLLALLSSPWEEVSARDTRDETQADSFPLTGTLAALQVGDGVRLDLPSVGVQDASPRQILGRTRAFTPDGMSIPTARFRQRPRSFRATVRRILKTAVAPQRNYQGGLTLVQGTIGSPTTAIAPDAYTRVLLPAAASSIAHADLIVTAKGDTSAKTIEINGVDTAITVTTIGRYPVTAWVARAGAAQQAYARLIGGTGSYDISLELTVRI